MAKALVEEHREVAHYTTAAGLKGIIASQSLWAANASLLNDSTEFKLFFDRRLRLLMESALRNEYPSFPDSEIEHIAHEVSESIENTTVNFNEPYIVSFCGVKDDRSRIDGLLSQWRGYGKDGGYAIFFDTVNLEDLLRAEVHDHLYQHCQWGDVHYYQDVSDSAHAAEEIVEAEQALQKAIVSFTKNPIPAELEPTFEPVLTLSCMYKHWGFHEEREVRIVAIPPNPALVEEEMKRGEVKPFRVPKFFIRNGCPVPYIDLFGPSAARAKSTPLPITRVLVGPHPQSATRRRAVVAMFAASGISAEVSVSEIPYIGG